MAVIYSVAQCLFPRLQEDSDIFLFWLDLDFFKGITDGQTLVWRFEVQDMEQNGKCTENVDVYTSFELLIY